MRGGEEKGDNKTGEEKGGGGQGRSSRARPREREGEGRRRGGEVVRRPTGLPLLFGNE